jgi:heme A synthase
VGQRSSLEVARQVAGSEGHFLEHLRSVHPILASLAVPFWISAGARFSGKWGWFIIASASLQALAGLLNIYLSAPGWMQVIHLALANALWVSWTLAWFSRHDSRA